MSGQRSAVRQPARALRADCRAVDLHRRERYLRGARRRRAQLGVLERDARIRFGSRANLPPAGRTAASCYASDRLTSSVAIRISSPRSIKVLPPARPWSTTCSPSRTACLLAVYDFESSERMIYPTFSPGDASGGCPGANWLDVTAPLKPQQGRRSAPYPAGAADHPRADDGVRDFLNDLENDGRGYVLIRHANSHPRLKERARFLAPETVTTESCGRSSTCGARDRLSTQANRAYGLSAASIGTPGARARNSCDGLAHAIERSVASPVAQPPTHRKH